MFQDVFLATGGAERIVRALATYPVTEFVYGLSAKSIVDQMPCEFPATILVEADEATIHDATTIRRALEKCLSWRGFPDQPLLSLHHHFALLAPQVPKRTIYYIHTPTRLLWEPRSVPWEVGLFDYEYLDHLRSVELANVTSASRIFTNSYATAARIRRFYEVQSTVLYPPTELWQKVGMEPLNFPILTRREYLFTMTRLAPSKRLMDAVQLRPPIPWIIAGSGRQDAELRRTAHESVHFIGEVSDANAKWLIDNSAACVATSKEDFGMFSAEALTMHKSVVVGAGSGITELHEFGNILTFEPIHTDDGASFLAAVDNALAAQPPSKASVYALRNMLSMQAYRDELWQALAAVD